MIADALSTGAKIAAGIPAAIAAIAGITQGVNKASEVGSDWRMRRRQKIQPPEFRGFYVKSTHVKHVIREEATEVIKFRSIRALQELHAITLDHLPKVMKDEIQGEKADVSPDFFAIPGVAFINDVTDFFLVSLAPDQVFKSGHDYTCVLVYKIPGPVDKIFPDPEREFTEVLRPLGTEKVTVEMHFPSSHDLKRIGGHVDLEVFELRPDGNKKKMDPNRYEVNAEGRITPIGGKGSGTDMFRLSILRPPQDADLEVAWKWSRRPEQKQ